MLGRWVFDDKMGGQEKKDVGVQEQALKKWGLDSERKFRKGTLQKSLVI